MSPRCDALPAGAAGTPNAEAGTRQARGPQAKNRAKNLPALLSCLIGACLIGPCFIGAGALAADTTGAPQTQQAQQEGVGSPIYGVSIPQGFRAWPLLGVAQETGALDELRAVLGNAAAVQAYRNRTLPFPDGTVLVKLAWRDEQSREFPAAFVPGAPTTVQVMVKDSKRYAATGGWGFGRFTGGVPADAAQHQTCYACHAARAAQHDLVFTRLAP